MASTTTAIWWITATLQILLHVLEISLQLHSAFTYLTSYDGTRDVTIVAYVMIGVIAFSSCVTNIVSAVWTYRGMDFTSQLTGGAICCVLHLLQLGPVWRYFKILLVGDNRDIEELFQLRILHVSLQNPAYIVMQGVLLLSAPPSQKAQLILGVTVSFISTVFSFACCSNTTSSSLTFVTNFESQSARGCSYNRKVCSVLRLLLKLFRHTFMLASRLLAFTLLAYACRAWVLVLVIGHLLIFYVVFLIWSIVKHNITHAPTIPIAKCLPEVIVFGIVEVFDFTSRLYRSNKEIVIYYSTILIENTIMGLIWFFTTESMKHNDTLLVFVFTFFILGVIACVFSEGFLHGTKDMALDDETMEKKNLDIVESMGKLSMEGMADNLALPDTSNKSVHTGQLDFDLDLKDILFASAYNTKVQDILPMEIPESNVNSMQQRESEVFSIEAQHSSDSGFVSRFFDLEKDSEGYSRQTTSPSVDDSSTFMNQIDPVNKTNNSQNDDADLYQYLQTSEMENKNNSIHSVASASKESATVNLYTRRHSRHKPPVHRTPKSWAGQDLNTPNYDTDISSQSSSCTDYTKDRMTCRQRKVYTRSRSVPASRRSNIYSRESGLYSGTSESDSDGHAHYRAAPEHGTNRRLVRRYHHRGRHPSTGSSSSSCSDSDPFWQSHENDYKKGLADSYYNSASGSSWWSDSDSQSLGDSEFGFTSTWPPGRRCSIVNIYQLPVEQISVKDQVVNWLKQVERTLNGVTSDSAKLGVNCGNIETNCGGSNADLSKERPLHRFDSFRDAHIAYIDTYHDNTHMSDTGIIGNKQTKKFFTRTRTLSEGGGAPLKSPFLKISAAKGQTSGKKKWLNSKLIQRLSLKVRQRKRKMIVVNREATYNSDVQMLGLESSV